MTKEEFTKLVKEKEQGCGLVTVVIPMKELRNADEEKWIKQYFCIDDSIDKETLAEFEEKGELRYTFDLIFGNISACAWLDLDVIGVEKETYWNNEGENNLNYWAGILERA